MNQRNPHIISKGIDWSIVWLYIILVVTGIAMIYANEYTRTNFFRTHIKTKC